MLKCHIVGNHILWLICSSPLPGGGRCIPKQVGQRTKIFQYCTGPAGRVTYNFHSSCKHMHLSFTRVCNKEHKGFICNMTLSNSSQSTRPTGRVLWKNYLSFLDFTGNYEQMSGIFVPCRVPTHLKSRNVRLK